MTSKTNDVVWLVRHGQSAANAGLPTDHPSNIPLTDVGVAQSLDLAEQIVCPPRWIAVSPFRRTTDTATPSIIKFPDSLVSVWPIQELTYLSPVRCRGTCAADRQDWAKAYWAASNPHAVDGEGAESFIEFMCRVKNLAFLLKHTKGFGIVVGHGMFLKAFLLGLEHGFDASSCAMRRFRSLESDQPLHNGQIIQLSRSQLM